MQNQIIPLSKRVNLIASDLVELKKCIKLTITTQDEVEAASTALLAISTRWDRIEKIRKQELEPYSKATKQINDSLKPFQVELDKLTVILKDGIKQFMRDEQKKAELAAIKQKQIEDEARFIQENIKETAEKETIKLIEESKTVDIDTKKIIDKQIEHNLAIAGDAQQTLDNLLPTPVTAAPTKIKTGQGTVYTKKHIIIEIINLNEIPREYLIPDLKAIQKAANEGITIAGVKMTEDFDVAGRRS